MARHLRKNETIAEKKLWRELRVLRKQGYHFRRQVPIDGYIVDFACYTHRIVIEVDGYQHFEGDGLAADLKRDAHLNWQGFHVLRFANSDISGNIEGVMVRVLAALGVLVRPE